MSNHRRSQNIRIPRYLRSVLDRSSVSRTVRDIRHSEDSRFSEIGAATVSDRDVIVATVGGKYWVIIELQHVKS